MPRKILLPAFLFFLLFVPPVSAASLPFGYHAPYNLFSSCQDFYFDGTLVNILEFIRRNENNLGWQMTRFSGNTGFAFWVIERLGWDYLDLRLKKTGAEIFAEIACPDTASHPLDQNLCNRFVESILKRYDGDCDVNEDRDCQDRICKHSLTQETTGCPDSDKIVESEGIIYPTIKYFQIGNEPELCWTYWCRPNEPGFYADHFVATARVIRNACPDCQIALGGIGSNFSFAENLLSAIGSANSNLLDIFDFHYFSGGWGAGWRELIGTKNRYLALLEEKGFHNKDIFVTELNYWPWWEGSLEEKDNSQGKELVKHFVYAVTHGIKALFWSQFLIENDRYGETFYRAGLIRPGKDGDPLSCTNADRKPGYQSYKTMTRHLAEFSSFAIEKEAEETYIYRFNFPQEQAKTVLVAWTGNSVQRTLNISSYLPEAILQNIKTQTALEENPRSPTSLNISVNGTPLFIIETAYTPSCDKLGEPTIEKFNLWKEEFLNPPTNPQDMAGDFNCNSQVNLVDFEIWRENFYQ